MKTCEKASTVDDVIQSVRRPGHRMIVATGSREACRLGARIHRNGDRLDDLRD